MFIFSPQVYLLPPPVSYRAVKWPWFWSKRWSQQGEDRHPQPSGLKALNGTAVGVKEPIWEDMALNKNPVIIIIPLSHYVRHSIQI